ncbi:transketolase [Hydrogenophaga sp. MI9]|uniref:transketolase n=1 Tax=Hydrogenophaga sp. MI9 TaxID=3453719 RepID=UPI003EEB4198
MQTTTSRDRDASAPLSADVAAVGRWRDRRQAFAAAGADERLALLRASSTHIRRQVLQTIRQAGLGHVGGDLSVTDVLVTLFDAVLDIDPADPARVDRDRFILSKGHCAAALYSVLAHAGFFDEARLVHFAAAFSPLNGHPNRRKVPGVETNTGPLGHGLPVAVGCATGALLAGQAWRTYVVLGDGELQEGSNWEAAMYAAQRGLGGLTAIVDRNRLQQGASTADTNDLEPLADKWAAFGWETHVVDGHSHAALLEVLQAPAGARPRAVIANTIKGKGVSFMENGVEWHHKVPSAEQVEAAIKELAA